MDNDKEIELIMFCFFSFNYNDKFQNLKCKNSFCDKDKLLNLRDKRVLTNMWGPLFSIYLQLYH